MKKEKTGEEKMQQYAKDLLRSIKNWKSINLHGCNDPFWPDGCNMNLERNHVIYSKRQMLELHEKEGIDLPEEYYLQTPPEVDDTYMANQKQKERVKRLRQQGNDLKRSKNDYDEQQMSLF